MLFINLETTHFVQVALRHTQVYSSITLLSVGLLSVGQQTVEWEGWKESQVWKDWEEFPGTQCNKTDFQWKICILFRETIQGKINFYSVVNAKAMLSQYTMLLHIKINIYSIFNFPWVFLGWHSWSFAHQPRLLISESNY